MRRTSFLADGAALPRKAPPKRPESLPRALERGAEHYPSCAVSARRRPQRKFESAIAPQHEEPMRAPCHAYLSLVCDGLR